MVGKLHIKVRVRGGEKLPPFKRAAILVHDAGLRTRFSKDRAMATNKAAPITSTAHKTTTFCDVFFGGSFRAASPPNVWTALTEPVSIIFSRSAALTSANKPSQPTACTTSARRLPYATM